MLTATEVTLASRLSVTFAVTEWSPFGALFQTIVHGAEVCSPILILFAKNSTLATEPSASLALAVMVMAWPSSNRAAALGEVTATRGNWLGAGA